MQPASLRTAIALSFMFYNILHVGYSDTACTLAPFKIPGKRKKSTCNLHLVCINIYIAQYLQTYHPFIKVRTYSVGREHIPLIG